MMTGCVFWVKHVWERARRRWVSWSSRLVVGQTLITIQSNSYNIFVFYYNLMVDFWLLVHVISIADAVSVELFPIRKQILAIELTIVIQRSTEFQAPWWIVWLQVLNTWNGYNRFLHIVLHVLVLENRKCLDIRRVYLHKDCVRSWQGFSPTERSPMFVHSVYERMEAVLYPEVVQGDRTSQNIE